MLTLLCLPALAAPTLDDPVRTGAQASADAAVVIGIEDYFKLPTVPHAERDAKAFHDLLLYTRGIPPQQLRLLDAGASRETMLEAVREAAERASDGGRVWVYFAGHGAASPSTGERMILGDDVRPELSSFEARAVSVSELEEAAGSQGHEVITVLDTCFTGHDRSGTELLAGKRFAVPSYAASKESSVQWVAASPNQFSGPLDGAEHGAFTYAVIGALRGWADGWISGQPDGRVTADEASVYVTEALRVLGVEDQDPVIVGDALSGLVLTEGTLEAAPDLSSSATATPPHTSKTAKDTPDTVVSTARTKKLSTEPPAEQPDPTYQWPTVTNTKESPTLGTLLCLSGGRFPMSARGRWEVTLTRGVCLMKQEVSQAQWTAMGFKNRSEDRRCEECPVDHVSWYDAVAYANRVSEAEGLTPAYDISGKSVRSKSGANGYRLPTRAEWNAAALDAGRASSRDAVARQAWNSRNSGGTSHPVCTLEPNGLGFCDLLGNVQEWVWDRDWDRNPDAILTGKQPLQTLTDPMGPSSGSRRMMCGGYFRDSLTDLGIVSANFGYDPTDRSAMRGLRLARPVD